MEKAGCQSPDNRGIQFYLKVYLYRLCLLTWVKVTQVCSACENSVSYIHIMLFLIFVGMIYINKIFVKCWFILFYTNTQWKNRRKYNFFNLLSISLGKLLGLEKGLSRKQKGISRKQKGAIAIKWSYLHEFFFFKSLVHVLYSKLLRFIISSLKLPLTSTSILTVNEVTESKH